MTSSRANIKTHKQMRGKAKKMKLQTGVDFLEDFFNEKIAEQEAVKKSKCENSEFSSNLMQT